MIKVYIVEDHSVVVEGLYALLHKEKDIEIVGHAHSGANCIQFLSGHFADLILMDIGLPDMNGVELCKLVRKQYPGIMVLALSTFDQGTYVRGDGSWRQRLSAEKCRAPGNCTGHKNCFKRRNIFEL